MTGAHDVFTKEATDVDSRGDSLCVVHEQIPPPLVHLAEAVKTRRRGLGLTRDALRRAGGPSDSTLARIENPDPGTAFPRPSTLARLDAALSWEPGSAASCLDLNNPQPAPGLGTAPEEQSTPTLSADPLDFSHVAVPASVIREGLDLMQRFSRAVDTDAAFLHELTQFAHHLGAAHATEVLERFAGAGRRPPEFLLTAFGPYLAEVAADSEVSPEQLEEQDYRRWLAGQQADDEARFSDRLRTKIRAIG